MGEMINNVLLDDRYLAEVQDLGYMYMHDIVPLYELVKKDFVMTSHNMAVTATRYMITEIIVFCDPVAPETGYIMIEDTFCKGTIIRFRAGNRKSFLEAVDALKTIRERNRVEYKKMVAKQRILDEQRIGKAELGL